MRRTDSPRNDAASALAQAPQIGYDASMTHATQTSQAASAATAATRPRIGVLGGMGPLATADFLAKLCHATPAVRDQDHFPVTIESAPQIPDRLAALNGTIGQSAARPYIAAKTPPRNGLIITAPPSIMPAMRAAGQRTPSRDRPATTSAIVPSAQAIACCGVYQRDLGRSSIERLRKNHEVMAKLFLFCRAHRSARAEPRQ